jgi:hypothetical protein
MIRRTLAVFAFAMVSLVFAPVAFAPGAGASTAAPVQQCMNDGWRILTDASGQPFGNQGQCIAYANHHPVTLADLASSAPFSVTATSVVAGCESAQVTFEAVYPGDPRVGTVHLQVSGCVSFTLESYEGSFTMTSEVGTLSGTAAGPVVLGNQLLTLHIDAATGLFAGTTGILGFSISPFTVLPFFGTVTVP